MRIPGQLLILLVAAPLPSYAGPQLTVRGDVRLQVISASYQRGISRIQGRLTDAALGSALDGRGLTVSVRVPGRGTFRRPVRTDSSGHFIFSSRLPPAVYFISIDFPAERFYNRGRLRRFFDLSKPTVELVVDAPPVLDSSKKTQRFSLALRSEGRYLALPIVVSVGQRPIARVATIAEGPVFLDIATKALGKPGPFSLSFHFAGNRQFNSALRTLRLTLKTPVTLELASPQAAVESGRKISLTGTIRDSMGPISGATVRIDAMGHHLASVMSNSAGNFSLEVGASDFPPGPLDLSAHFTPLRAWRLPTSTAILTIEIRPPISIPISHYLLPTALTVCVMLATLAWRHRDKLALSPRQVAAHKGSKPDAASTLPAPSGVRLGTQRHVRKDDFGVGGVIWDSVDQRPIPGARVMLTTTAGAQVEFRSDDLGEFRIDGLPRGPARLAVEALGYVPENTSIQLPHRGRYRGMRVELVAVRVRLLELYREEAVPRLSKPAQWGCWTPRDLLYRSKPQQLHDRDFRELSELFERSYWSEVPPAIDTLDQGRELASRCHKTRSATEA